MDKRARILVVDDDTDLLALYQMVLEAEGYQVQTAASGEDAITLAEGWTPELVLTDITMPGMDGLELIAHFRTNHAGSAPVLIANSALSGAAESALGQGAARFLTKPIGVDELLDVIASALAGAPSSVERYVAAKARERASARAMAEAVANATLEAQPELKRRATLLTRWLGTYFESASVALLLPHGGELRILSSSDYKGLPPDTLPEQIAVIANDVVETASTLVIPDLRAQRTLRSEGNAFQSIAGVPFSFRDVPIGALCLASRMPAALSGTDVALLELVARGATARISGETHEPLLTDAGLMSRECLRSLLEIEVKAAGRMRQGVSVTLFRVPGRLRLDRDVSLLEQLPAPRMLVAEAAPEVIAVAVRDAPDRLRASAALGAVEVHKRGNVQTSAEVVISAPVPARSDVLLLDWAAALLREGERSGRSLWIDASPRDVQTR